MPEIKNYVNIPKKEWVKLNTSLSTQYKTADNKTEIIEQLYRLNKPLFKSWNVFDKEDRPDFEQQSFLWTWKALESFNPKKGSFVAWLRWFVLKAWTEHQSNFNKKILEVEETELENKTLDSGEPDYVFWEKVEKEFPKDWVIIKAIFFELENTKELAKKLKISPNVLEQKKSTILQNLKAFRLKELNLKSQSDSAFLGETWITTTAFARTMGMTINYVRRLISPNSKSSYRIDKRDIIKKPITRISYLRTPEGLVYPRFIKRTNF